MTQRLQSELVEVYTAYDSPVGRLLLTGRRSALTGIYFMDGRHRFPALSGAITDATAFSSIIEELRAYFAGTRRTFSVSVRFQGTPFQVMVWEALSTIGYGQTLTYAALAARIGRPTAVRAVARAVASNPVSIVVPCHRVVGRDGRLTGYAGGIARKAWLLRHEAAMRDADPAGLAGASV